MSNYLTKVTSQSSLPYTDQVFLLRVSGSVDRPYVFVAVGLLAFLLLLLQEHFVSFSPVLLHKVPHCPLYSVSRSHRMRLFIAASGNRTTLFSVFWQHK